MSGEPRRVLVLCFSDLARDARVRRQVALLARRFSVCAAALGDPALPGVEFVRLPPLDMSFSGKVAWALKLKLGTDAMAYDHQAPVRAARVALAGRPFSLIVANDVATLPLARELAAHCGAKVIFDAHEFSPLEFEEDPKWRFFLMGWTTRLCRRHVPLVDGMITVCDGIADRWQRDYGVRPVVVPNATGRQDLPVPTSVGRPLRLVHHGIASRARGIELLVEAAKRWDECTLDLFLVPNDKAFVAELRASAAACPRVRVHDPVPVSDVVKTLHAYDVGVYLHHPGSFNATHMLPNKFFDFVQARLAICVSPLPEMKRLIEQFGMGRTTAGYTVEDLLQCVRSLDADTVLAMRAAAGRAAEELCWETYAGRIDTLVDRVLGAA